MIYPVMGKTRKAGRRLSGANPGAPAGKQDNAVSPSRELFRRIRSGPFLPMALIILAGLIAYSNTSAVPFTFDDRVQIVENPLIKDLGYYGDTAKAKGFFLYHALKMRYFGYLGFAVNYAIHGLRPEGYHYVNTAIHCINGILVYLLVVLTFRTPLLAGSPLRARASSIALFSSLLFTCHPIQTEAVTYIVQRFTSLATLFYLLAVNLYIRARLAATSSPARGFPFLAKSAGLYTLMMASMIMAMKTKEIAFTLPVIVIIYEFMFFEGTKKERCLYLLPMVAVILSIPIMFLAVYGLAAGPGLPSIMDAIGRATTGDPGISRSDYFFTQLNVIVTYLRLLFLPVGQNLDYTYPLSHSLFEAATGTCALLLLSILASCAYLFRTYREKASHIRLICFGVIWFFLTLSVESSVMPLKDAIFEHRLYLPSVGAFITITVAGAMAASRLGAGRGWAISYGAVFLTIPVICLIGLTLARNGVWKDEATLWEDVIRKSPQNARAYNNAGLAYLNRHEPGRAVALFTEAVNLDPKYSVAYNNRGVAHAHAGMPDRARDDFRLAVAINPQDAEAHTNFGYALLLRGEPLAALREYDLAIAANQHYPDAHNKRGVVLMQMGRTDEGWQEFNKAVELNPGYAEPYNNRAIAYGAKGDWANALIEYRKALIANPAYAEAYNNRGVAFLQMGRPEEAWGDLDKAVALNPGYAEAYNNRALAYGEKGDWAKALIEYRKALIANPAYGAAYYNRARLNVTLDRKKDAYADFQEACRLGIHQSCEEIGIAAK